MDPQNNSVTDGPESQTPPTNKTLMGVLAYLGVLVFIPLFTHKNDPFVKFHVKQGLVLFSIEVITWVVGSMFWPLWMLLNIVNLATLILSIIGIVNVAKNTQKELPIVGHLSSYFNI